MLTILLTDGADHSALFQFRSIGLGRILCSLAGSASPNLPNCPDFSFTWQVRDRGWGASGDFNGALERGNIAHKTRFKYHIICGRHPNTPERKK